MMVEKTWITCNACGADAFRTVSIVDGWQIGRCSRCSLVYVNPVPFFRPTDEFSEISLGFQYTQYMHQTISPAILEFERAQLRRQFEFVARLANGAPRGKRLLEVGCGSGASVRAALDLGWDAIGLDIDPQLIRLGCEQLQVDLRCTSLLDARLEAGQFDFIRLRDVIEHLPNPYESLVEIKRLLAPNGVAVFVTPNEGGLPTQVRTLVTRRHDRVATVPPPHHLHGFTPGTLKRIFDRVGFEQSFVQTTTPIDPMYVTSNNMRSAHRTVPSVLWRGARIIGKGSVLVGWVKN